MSSRNCFTDGLSYGSLDKEEVVRQARKQKEKEKLDAKVMPKDIKSRKTKEKNEVCR